MTPESNEEDICDDNNDRGNNIEYGNMRNMEEEYKQKQYIKNTGK